jgi:sugar lactone lactonase YvrE
VEFSCRFLVSEPLLLITTDSDIRSMPIDSEEYKFIQSDLSQALGVSVDYKEQSLYWSEKSDGKSGIYKSSLDGSRNQKVISVGVEEVGDLMVDGPGRHLYFVDSGRKTIVACDLQGTICVVVCGQLDKPRALAVYPEKRLLFWSDWGSHPHIASAGMDGSKRTHIITTDVAQPSGLAVDEATGRIFWGDVQLSRIESSHIDGSDRKVLQKEVNPFALALFRNLVFWCDPTEHEIISVDKNTGGQFKVSWSFNLLLK